MAGGTARARRVAGALALSSMAGRLLDLEASEGATDDEVARGLADLSARYAEYVAAHGRICENGALRDVSTVTRAGHLLRRMEVTDADGAFVAENAMLAERVSHPQRQLPEHIADVETALSVSLEQTTGVDVALIAHLLDATEAEAIEALGGRVLPNPDADGWLYAEDYLSGNVGEKLDHVRALIAEATTEREAELLRAWHLRMGIEDPELGRLTLLGEALESDWWRCVTGQDPDVAVDVAAGFDGTPYLRRTGTLRRFLFLLARESTEGAWDETMAHGANVGVMRMLRLAASWGVMSGAELDLLREFSRSRATTDDVMRYGVFSILRRSAEGRMALTALVEAAGVDYRVLRRQESEDEALKVLRERPEVLEWLLWCRGHHIDIADAARDRAGLEAFAERRREALAFEPDEGRLGALREVERRLVAALPEPIERKVIVAHLGSPWIPASVYLQFARERLCIEWASFSQLRRLSVAFDHEIQGWDVKYTDGLATEDATARYGIEGESANDASPFRLLLNAMRGTPTIITRPVAGDDGERHNVTDEELTLLAADKRATLEGDFVDWLWSDPNRAEALVRRYNERMNRQVARRFDGSYLTLADASEDIRLQPHQKDAVARVLRSPEGTLLAHAVGAGKTFEGIVAAHEARRIGKCEKPLVAVPNSVVNQWASEWARIYPRDRVLVMDAYASRNATARQRFWDAARSGQWDAVLVPHSQFDSLGISPHVRHEAITERIASLRRRMASDAGPRATLRRRQGAMRSMVDALRREDAALGDVTGPYMDEIGFDMLVVDEAHRYKHLGVRSAMSVAGIDKKSTKMSENLKRLCDHLRSQGKGDNIVFLTGTPVTNSVCELYVMQSYLAPKALEEVSLDSFDAWAATFGQVHREVEVKPEGGLQTKDRFSRFSNLPELMSMVHGFCDLVTNDDLSVELPDVKVVNVEVPPTAEQRMCMRWLEGRGDAIRKGRVRATEDNMLLITGDGKKVALDPKLLWPDDPAVPPMRGGKLDACAGNVADVWRRTTTAPDGEEMLGVQLVFCDASTDNGHWNVQAELRRRLVALGIPEEEVATVPGSLTPAQRERLFEHARAGSVRVLIGSTQTLGTGVSVQSRLAAIHDLDCPWRSSDLEQRLGRIKRQGNAFAGCDWFQPVDYRYATVGTFDSYLYQTTARKGAFVSQVMTNDSPLREASELSDVVLTLSEMKALASGNPAVRRRLELDNEIKSLQYRRSAWSREMDAAKQRLEGEVRPRLAELRQSCEGADKLTARLGEVFAARAQAAEDAAVWHPVTVGGITYPTDRDGLGQANLALGELVRQARYGHDQLDLARIGDLMVGVTWQCLTEGGAMTPRLSLTCEGGACVYTTVDARTANVAVPHVDGPVKQAFRLMDDADAMLRRRMRMLVRTEAEERDLTERVAAGEWPLEGELRRKEAELEALPVSASDALSRAEQFPHVSDVHAMLTGGTVLDMGGAARLPAPGVGVAMEADAHEAQATVRRHRR